MSIPHVGLVGWLHRAQSKMMHPINFQDYLILNEKINEFA